MTCGRLIGKGELVLLNFSCDLVRNRVKDGREEVGQEHRENAQPNCKDVDEPEERAPEHLRKDAEIGRGEGNSEVEAVVDSEKENPKQRPDQKRDDDWTCEVLNLNSKLMMV